MTDFSRIAWPVRTARLSIRPATMDAAAALYAYRSDPRVARWTSRLPTSLDAWSEVLFRSLDVQLVVERDGQLIGDLMLRQEDAWGQVEVAQEAAGQQAELGWCFAPSVWGNGYATEAVTALLAIAFREVGVRRVVANCFAENLGSRRVMERVGLRLEGHTVKDSLHRDGHWYDGMVYALLVEEWSAD